MHQHSWKQRHAWLAMPCHALPCLGTSLPDCRTMGYFKPQYTGAHIGSTLDQGMTVGCKFLAEPTAVACPHLLVGSMLSIAVPFIMM